MLHIKQILMKILMTYQMFILEGLWQITVCFS